MRTERPAPEPRPRARRAGRRRRRAALPEPFAALVRRARLDAAAAPAGAARSGARAALDAADRADRRRQDAGRLPAEPRRASRSARARKQGAGLHTLYISPLKALAADVARNLMAPIAEMGLPIRTETRTGDTSVARRPAPAHAPARHPADDARADRAAAEPPRLRAHLFADLDTVILDELHALAATKRGDLLALDLARLRTLAPGAHDDRAVGDGGAAVRAARLSRAAARAATAHRAGRPRARSAAAPSRRSRSSSSTRPMPWAGHTTRYAIARDLRGHRARTA